MADIPAMTLASATVDVSDIYTAGLFAPANPPLSLEILNGGLDENNRDVAAGSSPIPTYAVRYGTFAAGYYYGFDRYEFMYARQVSGDPALRVVHAGLCARLFVPWDAQTVWYGFQGLFLHDATVWDVDGLDDAGNPTTAKREYWDFRVLFDNVEVTGLEGRLPSGRTSDSSPTWSAAPPAFDPPGVHNENRWRYVSRTGAAQNVQKGYRTIRVTFHAAVFATDLEKAKLKTPSAALWCLAVR